MALSVAGLILSTSSIGKFRNEIINFLSTTLFTSCLNRRILSQGAASGFNVNNYAGKGFKNVS